MTLRNRLIAEAKKNPAEIVIRQCAVGDVVNHATGNLWTSHNKEKVREALMNGTMKLLGVPLRVSGT